MSPPATSDWMPDRAPIDRARRWALLVGAVGAVGAGLGGLADGAQFFRSYLVGWLYVLAVPLGCLAILMLHHVTKGAWGVVIRRILEASVRTLPLLALFFVPIVLGMGHLYEWSDPEVVAHDEIVAGKAAYLNRNFFLVRAAIYFAVWIGLATYLVRQSRRQDESGEPHLALRMQGMSGAGLVLYVLTASFASFDWLMSLDPHWFSSIYGIWFVGGQNLAGLAFVVPVAMLLAKSSPLREAIRPSHFHDYGKLLLAFTMLWAYFSLSQFLIIWSGNLPEEIPWYLARTDMSWQLVSQILVLLHFALPFLLLLSTDLKRDSKRLALVATFLLAMRWLDLFWQASPSMEGTAPHWLDLSCVLGIGGLWLYTFLTLLRAAPLLPRNEPFLEAALRHE